MSLPNGYTRLEYIESTGVQYIDTGFKPNNNTRVVIDVQYTGAGTTSQWFFGVRDSTNLKFDLCIYNSKTKVYDGYIAQNTTYTITNARHTYDKNKNITSIDGIKVHTFTEGTISLTRSMYLFALNNAGTTIRPAPSKLYSCQIYDNGTLVRDFIPARNASGIVGLWDNVNSVFYANAGTGTFTAGPAYLGTHKTLVNGTAYEVTGGKCLVNGVAYSVKKGLALVDGTETEIKFQNGYTWVLNKNPNLSSGLNINVSFTSNGTQFSAIFSTYNEYGGYAYRLKYNRPQSTAIQAYYYIATSGQFGWTDESYRTITFDEEPTGDLLTWLQANATPQ